VGEAEEVITQEAAQAAVPAGPQVVLPQVHPAHHPEDTAEAASVEVELVEAGNYC